MKLSVAALCLAFAVVTTSAYAEEPQGRGQPLLRRADLVAERGLDARLELTGSELEDLLAGIQNTTHRSLVVLGPVSMNHDEVAGLKGVPVRNAMRLLARKMNSEWGECEEFYVLFPAKMTRHAAMERVDTDHDPALNRKLTSGVADVNLAMALKRLGRQARMALRLGGFRVPPEILVRSTWPCAVYASGRTVGDVMTVLSVMLGDPWDREGTTRILCCTGAPLTVDDRHDLAHVLALDQFEQKLTAAQARMMETSQGLSSEQLTPYQRRDLARAIAPMLARKGITAESVVLRRLPAAGGGFSSMVNVYVPGASGSVMVGGLSLPQ